MERFIGVVERVLWLVIMVLGIMFIPKPWSMVFVGVMVLGGLGAVGKEWWDYHGPHVENESTDFFTFGDALDAFTSWYLGPLCAVFGAVGSFLGVVLLEVVPRWAMREKRFSMEVENRAALASQSTLHHPLGSRTRRGAMKEAQNLIRGWNTDAECEAYRLIKVCSH